MVHGIFKHGVTTYEMIISKIMCMGKINVTDDSTVG
jgi:hypothetical protein